MFMEEFEELDMKGSYIDTTKFIQQSAKGGS